MMPPLGSPPKPWRERLMQPRVLAGAGLILLLGLPAYKLIPWSALGIGSGGDNPVGALGMPQDPSRGAAASGSHERPDPSALVAPEPPPDSPPGRALTFGALKAMLDANDPEAPIAFTRIANQAGAAAGARSNPARFVVDPEKFHSMLGALAASGSTAAQLLASGLLKDRRVEAALREALLAQARREGKGPRMLLRKEGAQGTLLAAAVKGGAGSAQGFSAPGSGHTPAPGAGAHGDSGAPHLGSASTPTGEAAVHASGASGGASSAEGGLGARTAGEAGRGEHAVVSLTSINDPDSERMARLLERYPALAALTASERRAVIDQIDQFGFWGACFHLNLYQKCAQACGNIPGKCTVVSGWNACQDAIGDDEACIAACQAQPPCSVPPGTMAFYCATSHPPSGCPTPAATNPGTGTRTDTGTRTTTSPTTGTQTQTETRTEPKTGPADVDAYGDGKATYGDIGNVILTYASDAATYTRDGITYQMGTVKDKSGAVVGKYYTDPSGWGAVYDANEKKLYSYDAHGHVCTCPCPSPCP